MSNVVPFPQPDAKHGYCARCAHEITVPHAAAWPETCPGCRVANPALTSWKPEWKFTWTASGGIS